MSASKYDVSKGQTLADVWELCVGHSSSFGIKTAVLLGIPEILCEAGHAVSVAEVADKLPGSDVQVGHLLRLLDFLSAKKVIDKVGSATEEGVKFEPNTYTQLLTKSNFGGLVLLQNELITSGWHTMHEFILHGGKSPFERANGSSIWEHAMKNPELALLFSKGMVAMSNVTMEAVLAIYDGFEKLEGVLVDVGGGFGSDTHRIVSLYPKIRGINLEIPMVVHVAPPVPGVEHVAGDMFQSIPKADNILLKAVLHDFNDEAVLLVLRNCYDALPKGGKAIIVDILMDQEGGPFQALKRSFDMVLMALTNGGVERTKAQWTELLEKTGFQNIKYVASPSVLQAVVEAEK